MYENGDHKRSRPSSALPITGGTQTSEGYGWTVDRHAGLNRWCSEDVHGCLALKGLKN